MNVNTRNYFIALTCASLIEKGYDTKLDSNGYIIANDNENAKLLIYPMGRKLSDVNEQETTSVHKDEQAIQKLKEIASDDFIPCIAFGVAKYDYNDSEVCIVPVKVCEQENERGKLFSYISAKYRYNYAKAGAGTPTNAILRTQWNSK